VFIQDEIALSEFVLDGLAQELASGPATAARDDLYATLARDVLSLAELNALDDLGVGATSGGGAGSMGNGTGGTT
jgi:hypothetical protein